MCYPPAGVYIMGKSALTPRSPFNLTSAVRPAGLLEFARLVSPELRRRGLLAHTESGATYGETILGAGPRLAPDHPGLRATGVTHDSSDRRKTPPASPA